MANEMVEYEAKCNDHQTALGGSILSPQDPKVFLNGPDRWDTTGLIALTPASVTMKKMNFCIPLPNSVLVHGWDRVVPLPLLARHHLLLMSTTKLPITMMKYMRSYGYSFPDEAKISSTKIATST